MLSTGLFIGSLSVEMILLVLSNFSSGKPGQIWILKKKRMSGFFVSKKSFYQLTGYK